MGHLDRFIADLDKIIDGIPNKAEEGVTDDIVAATRLTICKCDAMKKHSDMMNHCNLLLDAFFGRYRAGEAHENCVVLWRTLSRLVSDIEKEIVAIESSLLSAEARANEKVKPLAEARAGAMAAARAQKHAEALAQAQYDFGAMIQQGGAPGFVGPYAIPWQKDAAASPSNPPAVLEEPVGPPTDHSADDICKFADLAYADADASTKTKQGTTAITYAKEAIGLAYDKQGKSPLMKALLAQLKGFGDDCRELRAAGVQNNLWVNLTALSKAIMREDSAILRKEFNVDWDEDNGEVEPDPEDTAVAYRKVMAASATEAVVGQTVGNLQINQGYRLPSEIARRPFPEG